MVTAFEYLMEEKAFVRASRYPYKANDTVKCRRRKSQSNATVVSYETIESGDEKLLKLLVATYGPTSVAIDASLASFQSYKTGIYFDAKCTTEINHAMLLCGESNDLDAQILSFSFQDMAVTKLQSKTIGS